MLVFFWYCASDSLTKIVKKTRRNAALFQKKCTESCCFFIDFGAIFPPGGTPGASRAPLGAQVVSQVDFLMFFSPPGGGFGAPFGPFGLPLGSFGAPLGSLGRQKWRQKCEKDHSRRTLGSRVDFGTEKGGARTPIM